MINSGNLELSAVGFFNPQMGQAPIGAFFGGGVGGGGGVGRAFDIKGDKVINCALVFGRALVSCGDTQIEALKSEPAGIIYAQVTHQSSELSLSVKHSSSDALPENTLGASYRLLYKAINKSWVDYRYMPTLFAMN